MIMETNAIQLATKLQSWAPQTMTKTLKAIELNQAHPRLNNILFWTIDGTFWMSSAISSGFISSSGWLTLHCQIMRSVENQDLSKSFSALPLVLQCKHLRASRYWNMYHQIVSLHQARTHSNSMILHLLIPESKSTIQKRGLVLRGRDHRGFRYCKTCCVPSLTNYESRTAFWVTSSPSESCWHRHDLRSASM